MCVKTPGSDKDCVKVVSVHSYHCVTSSRLQVLTLIEAAKALYRECTGAVPCPVMCWVHRTMIYVL